MSTVAVQAQAGRRLPSDRIIISGIIVVALIIRVIMVVATRHQYVPVDDAADFSRIARSISQGHGFGRTVIPGISGPSAFRTPLWPALLGAVYWVFGVSWTAARLVLAVLSAGLVGLIGAVCWRLTTRRVGLLAMAIAAVYPPLIMASYGLNYETLMGLTVFGALLCTLEWCARPARWWLLVLAGVLSGLAVLCRENAGLILIPIILLIARQLRGKVKSGTILRMGLVVVCALLVVTPWTIRNAVRLHHFIPVSDSPGIALAGTYNPSSQRSEASWAPAEVVPAYVHFLKDLPKGSNEADYSAQLQSAAVSYAEHHPSYLLHVGFWNTVRFFDLKGPRDSNWLAPLIPWPRRLIELSVVSFYVLAAVSLFGIVRRRIREVPWSLWTFPILWFLSVIFSSTIIQYRFIVEPFFILMAAITVIDFFEHRKSASPQPLPVV